MVKDCPQPQKPHVPEPTRQQPQRVDPRRRATAAEKGKRPVTQGRVFALDKETADTSAETIRGTLSVCDHKAHVLIDSGSTHSFISEHFACRLNLKFEPLEYILHVNTPMRESQRTELICRGCEIKVGDSVMLADLIRLNIHGFDVILGMDWLATNRVSLDCYTKIVTFSLPEPYNVRLKY